MTDILDTIQCRWLRNPQHFEAWSPLHLHMEGGGGKTYSGEYYWKVRLYH